MNTTITRKALAAGMIMLLFIFQASAQNKDVDKGKEELAKALDQKDAAKKNEMIAKAKESFTKGKLKPQEQAVLLGDAYLDKGDLDNAKNSYNGASKEDKKDGLKKVADAFADQAFSGDEKTMAKSLSKAMDLYKKSDALKEGARNIGDKFYAKGPDSYSKALDYYIIGGSEVKVESIAKELFDKGGDNEDKAAELYLKLKTPTGYKKGGDIYFNRKEYQKAIDAYQAGNVSDGLKKYADYLYSQNRNEEADNLYVKVAEIMATGKDDSALEKLGNEVTGKGRYDLAARIYDKAGNSTMSDKSHAYEYLSALKLDSAKVFFTNVNDMAMVKAITDNEKALTPLRDLAENFDDIMKGAPSVNMITDSVSGQSTPSASDQKTLEDYYKSVREQIIKNVYDVSAKIAKVTNPDMAKYARQRFLRYGAIRKILNPDTFAIVKQKADIKTKDVVL